MRWSGFLILALFFLIAGLCIALLSPRVQTWLGHRLAELATERTGADIRIGSVSLALDGSVRFSDVHVGDLRGDTLFIVPELKVKGLRILAEEQLIKLSRMELHNARFKLYRGDGDAHSNLTNLLNKLATGDTTAGGEDWTIRCRTFLIDRLHFSYHDGNTEPKRFGVDFSHIDIPDAHVQGSGLAVIGDSIHADLDRVSLTEHSGFALAGLHGGASVSRHGIEVTDMDLRTPRTSLKGQLHMIADGWKAFDEFTSSVALRLDLDSSRLDMADIAWFAPELEGIELPLGISGKVRGTISELKGRGMKISFGRESRFEGDAELSGLPHIDDTFMLIDVDQFHTTLKDAGALPVPPFTTKGTLELPAETAPLGYLNARGRFTGFLHSFTATGRGETALGDLRTDISYERDTTSRRIQLSGRAASSSFQLGTFLGIDRLGAVAADVRLKAKGRSLRTMAVDLDGNFPLLTINGRGVTGIKATGHIERDLFNGELSTRDQNLILDFKGLADLRGRWPLVDFKAELHHADLKALGFSDAPGYNALSLDAEVKGRLSPDSLLGDLLVKGISYCEGGNEHDLGDIHLHSDRQGGRNVLRLDASFAEAVVEGDLLLTRLPKALAHVVYSVFPSASKEVRYDQEPQDFTFELRTRDTDPLCALFIPDLHIDSGAVVNGSFNTRTFDLGLTATIHEAEYRNIRLDSFQLVADKTLDLLALSVRSTRQFINDSIWFGGTAITGKAYQDELELEVGWDTSSSGTHGDLELLGEVRGLRSMTLDLLPSDLYFGRGNWQNRHTSHIEIDSSTVTIDSLVLHNGAQRIAFDGTIARDPQAAMAFHLEQVDLLNLEHLLDGPVLRGTVSGDGRLFSAYDSPYLVSYLCGDSLKVRDKPLGDVRFSATWLEERGALDLNGTVVRGPIKALDFTGRMGIKKGNELDMVLIMDRFDMALVEPYLPEGLSNIGGLVTGDVALTGTIDDPQLNGEVMLTDAGIRIDYLNTRYTFSSKVGIAPDMFTMDLATMHDQEGHSGKISATVIHRHLDQWNYDIWGSVDRMLVLSTTSADNGLYYGRGYATGDFEVSGSDGILEITVDARTDQGTSIHFPVGGSTEVSPIGFVRFSSLDTTATDEAVDLTGVSLDMDLEVTPDAYFELIFDPTVGDIMSGRGRGNIKMAVTSTGEFSMTGQVELAEGDYLFTLRNVVNKRFSVEPGGRIVWYGDPFDAQLDLRATYKVRASLYDIVPPSERTEAYRKRVPVDVVMKLKDKLMNPEIGFQVRLPSVDESVRAQVNSVLSTEQELNRQVFALIVLNKFLEPPAYVGTGAPSGTGNVATTTTSELLSNQVSNWLSGLSNDFDLGLNYRPGDNITQDELEVMVSTQLFNERLLLTTNLGVQYGARANTNNSNTVVGDFQLEYLMTDDGRFRLRAFNMTNDRNLNQADQAPTTQGGGIVYRKDVEKFWDLFKRDRDRVPSAAP